MSLKLTEYSVIYPSPPRLFQRLKKEKVQACSMVQIADTLKICVSFFQKKRFERILKSLNCEYEIVSESLADRLVCGLKKRCGLAFGAVLCLAAMFILRNYAVSIEILTDSDEVRQEVTNILSDNGVKAGVYIPSIDCTELERTLKQRVSTISWAGVSITDSTLIIDVIENVPQPQTQSERLPSNLIATHSGVIEKVELYNGELMKTLGSGVVRGDILVSGKITTEKTVVKDGEAVTEYGEKYVKSIGKIYGTYTDTQVFEQPLSETRMVGTSKSITRNYLEIFSVEIPLFFGSDNGFYTEEESIIPLEILGEITPVGLRRATLTGYSFETVLYSVEQAEAMANKLRQNYEADFLSDCVIKSRNSDMEITDEKAVMTVTYEIYGLMSEEQQFFIKK